MIIPKEDIVECARRPYDALVLFGSYSRGDYNEESDVDILQISLDVGKSATYTIKNFNYSVYSFSQLMKMAEDSSLFVLHIIKEGTLIQGNVSILNDLKNTFYYPSSYENYRYCLKKAAGILPKSEPFYIPDSVSNFRLLMYLFRSYLYSELYDHKKVSFSLDSVIDEFSDKRLMILQEEKKNSDPSFELFSYIYNLFDEYSKFSSLARVDRQVLLKWLKSSNVDLFFVVAHFLTDLKEDSLYL